MSTRTIIAESFIEGISHQIPWWAISLIIHSILLILLATINFSVVQQYKPREIEIGKWVELPPTEQTPENVMQEIKEIDPDSPSKTANTEKRRIEDEVPTTRSQPIGNVRDIIGIDIGRLVGSPDIQGSRLPKGLHPIPDGPASTPPVIVDKLAEMILKEIGNRPLLVALLFDKSGSLVEDRKAIVARIEKTMKDLNGEMTVRERNNLKWAVVGFAEKPELLCNATSNMAEVKKQAGNMEVAASPAENVVEALEFILKTFGPLRKAMFIVALTDEEGNDTKDPARMETLVNNMRAAQARLFVIGREAMFQQGTVIEWPVDHLGERTGKYTYVDRGIESAGQEYVSPDWLFSTQAGRSVGSGFGCYSLTTLCALTGGQFFILSPIPLSYDDETMKAYSPEWVLKNEYNKRNKGSKLRGAIAEIVNEWGRDRPAHWLTKLDRLKAQAAEEYNKAKKCVALVDEAIDELDALRGRRDNEKFASKRWEANYELTLAGLYKFKFMLGEYVHVMKQTLKKGFPKPRPKQKFNLFRVYYDWKATEPNTGRRGARDWDTANRALDRVVEKHPGTPWAEMAKHEKKFMAPLLMEPHFWISGWAEEGSRSGGQPK